MRAQSAVRLGSAGFYAALANSFRSSQYLWCLGIDKQARTLSVRAAGGTGSHLDSLARLRPDAVHLMSVAG